MWALTPHCAVNNWCVSVSLIPNRSNASLPAVTTRSQESSEVFSSVALCQYRYSCILLVALPAHVNLASSVV
jgi:hypothetical protein